MPNAILIQAAKGSHHVFDRKPRGDNVLFDHLVKSPLPGAGMNQLQPFMFHQERACMVNAKVLRKLAKVFKVVVEFAAARKFVDKALLEIPRRTKIREIGEHGRQHMRIVAPFFELEHGHARSCTAVVHRQNAHQGRFPRNVRFHLFRFIILEGGQIQAMQSKQQERVGRRHFGKFQEHANHVAARQRILAVAIHVHLVVGFKKRKPAFRKNQFNGLVDRAVRKRHQFCGLLL